MGRRTDKVLVADKNASPAGARAEEAVEGKGAVIAISRLRGTFSKDHVLY